MSSWGHTLTHICVLLSTNHPWPGFKPREDSCGQEALWWLAGLQGLFHTVLHLAPLCLSGTRTLNQLVTHVDSTPVSTPNPLCAVRKKTGLTFCLCSGTNQMPRKDEQILPLMSLWNYIVPWAELPHLQYGPGKATRCPEVQGCLGVYYCKGIRLG